MFNSTTGAVQLQLNSVSATNVIWGTTSPYASNVIWGTNVNGTNVIWGASVPSGSNVLWGTNVLRGTNAVYAQSTPGAELLTIAINGDK